MNAIDCEECRQRLLRHQGGDAFNATASPLDDGVETLCECTSSFKAIASYFYAGLARCRSCGSIWLAGYYEDFSARSEFAEWGERNFIWRALDEKQIAEIGAARDSRALDMNTFAASQ